MGDPGSFSALRAAIIAVMRAAATAPLPDSEFDALAVRAFRYQCAHNPPYARFATARGARDDTVSSWRDVPPVPTMAFKEMPLISSGSGAVEAVFRTSGTTMGSVKRGEHHIPDLSLYHESLVNSFRANLLPDGAELDLLSLIPSPEGAPDSSLSHMIGVVSNSLVGQAHYFVSAEGDLDEAGLLQAAVQAEQRDQPVLVVATAFAVVHWLDGLANAGRRIRLPAGSRMMETGGFKGRSRTIPRHELYAAIEHYLGLPDSRIVNEYGMTELLSQFYEPVLRGEPRLHRPPPWVRTRVVDPVTLERCPPGREGLLCHFDLANLGSVCAVLTEDLGVVPPSAEDQGFRLIGRSAEAEPRGCSIAMDELITAARRPRL